ncbi:hypothetical protein Slin14017_G045770 [Septoria linicola]|nr:hypothetical protein Slin14017_G045770 [Septoria linicola]
MEFPIDEDFNTELRFDIYFSRVAHKNGHALWSSDGAIKSEFTKFRVQLTDVDVDWSSHNFERYLNEGKSYFNVQGLIEVTGSAQQLHLTVKLLAPDQIIKYHESSSSKQQDDLDLCPDTKVEYKIIATVRSEIWHTHRSHKLAVGSHAPIAVRDKDKDRSSARDGKKRRFDDRTTPSMSKRTKTNPRMTGPELTAGAQQRGGREIPL